MTELEGLLSKASATQRMRAAGIEATATPIYVRHKPGETTIVAYQFDLDDGNSTYGYARWCANPARAEKIFSKSMAQVPRPSLISSRGVDCLDEHTVLYSLPNDARLVKMHLYSQPHHIPESLASLVDKGDRISSDDTTVELLRYKPARRIVNHVSLRTDSGMQRELLVRYTTTPSAAELKAHADHLRANGVETPAPVAVLEDGKVTVDEFIDGEPLRQAVTKRTASPKTFADALLAFHHAPIPGTVPSRTPTDEYERINSGLRGLGLWRPQLAATATQTERTLLRTRPTNTSQPRLLHGDLHTNNLLQTEQGLSFVDLERMSSGDPSIDLGYLLSNGIARTIRYPDEPDVAAVFAHEVLSDYRQRSEAISEPTLRWHTAIGFVEQALLVARHLEADWSTKTQQLLELACDTVDHATSDA